MKKPFLFTLLFAILIFSINAQNDLSLEYQKAYIELFKKYKDRLVSELTSLGVTNNIYLENKIDQFYDRNQFKFKGDHSIIINVLLDGKNGYQQDRKVDHDFTKIIFNEKKLEIITYKGADLSNVRLHAVIPYSELRVEGTELSSKKPQNFQFLGKERYGVIRLAVMPSDKTKRQEIQSIIYQLTGKSEHSGFTEPILKAIEDYKEDGFLRGTYDEYTPTINNKMMRPFFIKWNNLLSQEVYFEFYSSVRNEFDTDMRILDALRCTQISQITNERKKHQLRNRVSVSMDAHAVLQSQLLMLKNQKVAVEKYPNLFALWALKNEPEALNEKYPLTDTTTFQENFIKQKELYSIYGRISDWEKQLIIQLKEINNQKSLLPLLYEMSLNGERSFWDYLIASDQSHFNIEQQSVLTDMKMLKQRSYFLLRGQYLDLKSKTGHQYSQAKANYQACGIRSDVLASIPYQLSDNTSDFLIAYLAQEKALGETILSIYKQQKEYTAKALFDFISAPSWMDYNQDENGNILMSDADIAKLKANNAEASNKTTDYFIGFIKVLSTSYAMKELQTAFNKAQLKLQADFNTKYGSKITKVLIAEFTLHCGTEEAQERLKQWR